MKKLNYILFCIFLVGCSAPQPAPVPKNAPRISVNSYLLQKPYFEQYRLNKQEKGDWEIIYSFVINDDNLVEITPSSQIDFFYAIQHSTKIELKSSNFNAVRNFSLWLKNNGVDKSIILKTKNQSNKMTVKIIRENK